MQLFSGWDSSNYSSRDAEWAIIFPDLMKDYRRIWCVYMEVRGDLLGTFYLHLIHPHAIQDISLSIDSTYAREYIWYPNTFRLYRHLIGKHRWFSIAMKKRVSRALYFLFWWFWKSTFNNLWRYCHILFQRENTTISIYTPICFPPNSNNIYS